MQARAMIASSAPKPEGSVTEDGDRSGRDQPEVRHGSTTLRLIVTGIFLTIQTTGTQQVSTCQ